MKIYIVNYGPHMNEAIEKLKNTCPLINLTEGNVNVFATDRLAFDIEQVMKATKIEKCDYLLLGGNTVINGIANLIMYDLVGKVNYLIYDAKNKDYVKRDNIRVKLQHGEVNAT